MKKLSNSSRLDKRTLAPWWGRREIGQGGWGGALFIGISFNGSPTEGEAKEGNWNFMQATQVLTKILILIVKLGRVGNLYLKTVCKSGLLL